MTKKTYTWARGVNMRLTDVRAMFAKLKAGMEVDVTFMGGCTGHVTLIEEADGALAWNLFGPHVRDTDGLPGASIEAVSFTVDEPDEVDPTEALGNLFDAVTEFKWEDNVQPLDKAYEDYYAATKDRKWKLVEELDRDALDKLGEVPEGAILFLLDVNNRWSWQMHDGAPWKRMGANKKHGYLIRNAY